MITRPDKGSGVVNLDKTFFELEILKLINDVNKFIKTLTRERQLPRFLTKIKDKGLFDDNT